MKLVHSDECVSSFFLHLDEIENCLIILCEETKDTTLLDKILRSLAPKFELKVLAIEEKNDMQTLTVIQIHGILAAFEMREGGPSEVREAAFKASAKGKEMEEQK